MPKYKYLGVCPRKLRTSPPRLFSSLCVEGPGEAAPCSAWLAGSQASQEARARQNQTLLLQGVQAKHLPRKKCLRSLGGYLGQKKSKEEDCRVSRERSAVQASLYSRFFQQPLGAYLVYTGVNPSPLGSLEASSTHKRPTTTLATRMRRGAQTCLH